MARRDDSGEQRSLQVTEQDVETVFSRSFVTLTEEFAMSYVQARYDPDDEKAEYWRCKLKAQDLFDGEFNSMRAVFVRTLQLSTTWPGNDAVDRLQQRREQLRLSGEQKAQRNRQRDHPLAHRDRRDHRNKHSRRYSYGTQLPEPIHQGIGFPSLRSHCCGGSRRL